MAETKRHQGRFSRMNDRYAVGLSLIAAGSAVPLASNRPGWWMLWTGLIALMAALHLIQAARIAPNRQPRFLAQKWLFGAALLVPAYAMVQALPIAGVLPQILAPMRSGMEGLRGATLSVAPDASLIGALRVLGYILFLALVVEVATRRQRLTRIGRIVFIGITLQAIWALVALKLLNDFSFWGEKTSYQGAATGTFVNRNSLATFLGFGLVLGTVLVGRLADGPRMRMSRPQSLPERLGFEGGLILLGMLLILLALVATQSRLGLLASALGVATTFLLLRRRSGLPTRRLWAESGVILLIFAIGLAIFGANGVLQRLLFIEGDGGIRLDLYRQTLGMVALRPLTGFGFDAFGVAFEAFRSPPLNGRSFYDLAHNSYLGLWAEQGLIIGSIPPILLTIAGVISWRRLSDEQGFPSFAAGAIGVLVMGGVHSLGDFSLEVPANNFVFLLLVGLGIARKIQSEGDDPAPVAAKPLQPVPSAATRTLVIELSPQPGTKGEDNTGPST